MAADDNDGVTSSSETHPGVIGVGNTTGGPEPLSDEERIAVVEAETPWIVNLQAEDMDEFLDFIAADPPEELGATPEDGLEYADEVLRAQGHVLDGTFVCRGGQSFRLPPGVDLDGPVLSLALQDSEEADLVLEDLLLEIGAKSH